MNLVLLALAPIFIILIYIYERDKYDREPISLLLKAILLGLVITIPISFTESFLATFNSATTQFGFAFYYEFIVAAFTEELFKFAGLYIINMGK